MSEPHPSEDTAALYLLGELTPAERRAFEAELAQSAELRELVRDLEESAVLLARSSPQRRPPAKVWQAIEKAVSAEAKRKAPLPLFSAWWQPGWAAAAACLLGWLLYAAWINHRTPAQTSRPETGPEILSQTGGPPSDHSPARNPKMVTQFTNRLAHSPSELPNEARELIRLRHETTALQNRVTRLSQIVAQQQALLGESNRLKFFQVPESSSNAGTAPTATLSPALQRAMFLAMARELGWLSSPNVPGFSSPVPFSPSNIDFVDLRPATNSAASAPPPPSNTQAAPHAPPEISSPANAPVIAVPAFTSGNNLVVAIDQSILPAGTQINFFNQDLQSIGSTMLGDNPVVVTVPLSLGGGSIFFSTGNGAGFSNVFQYFTPLTTYP